MIKKRIAISKGWLALSLLLALSLVVSACAPAAPPPAPTAEQAPAPTVEQKAPTAEEKVEPPTEAPKAPTAEAKPEEMKPIALKLSRSTSLPWPETVVSDDQGFYKAAGLEVESTKFQSGREAFDALIGGSVDIATVALTPVVFAAFQDQKVAIIAENASNPNNVITARTDAGITKAEDLRGKKIGTALGSDLHYFLDAFLAVYGMKESDVEVVNAPPNDMVTVLQKGDVDAFSIWQPLPYFAKEQMGDKVVLLKPPDGTYEARYLLVTSQDYLAKNPDAVERFLKAFKMADDYIASHPEETTALVATDLAMEPKVLKSIFSDYRVGLRLEPTLITEAEKQAQWAMDTGSAPAGAKMPNFKALIFTDALSKVVPDAVTLK